MTKQKATIIDGAALAELWLGDIAAQAKVMGAPLHLAAVCADPPGGAAAGLKAFVNIKRKAAEKIRVSFSSYLPESELEARQTLNFLAKDESVHGVFVELPLPAGWNRAELLELIPLAKDVDLISPTGTHAFHDGTAPVLPPAVSALSRVLDFLNVETDGLSAAIVGQGDLVGKPVIHWLRRQGSNVSVIDIDTDNPEEIASGSDLVVCGAGVPGLVTASWVKDGATVIDFGYAKKGNSYVGDVADSVKEKAGALTPVPGGMGPLVVAATLENLLLLATN